MHAQYLLFVSMALTYTPYWALRRVVISAQCSSTEMCTYSSLHSLNFINTETPCLAAPFTRPNLARTDPPLLTSHQ
jgi:hypothetical protein